MNTIEWVIEPFNEADGKGYYEKFPKGHIAEGKIRARYLTEPSQAYLDEMAKQPKLKTIEELQKEEQDKFALLITDSERIKRIAEKLGLIKL